MQAVRAGLSILSLGAAAAFVNACVDSAQSPPARAERTVEALEGTTLGPIDLVYVCGNKFLVINSTKTSAQVEYRVAGTDETGGLTLREGPSEDPGYSETDLVTRERGIVELYQDGERIARAANGGTACGAPAISASVVGTSNSASGSWSDPFPLPIVALHVSLLPTGKVLMWGHLGTPQVWDPATGGLTPVPSPAWVFCAGHSFLADGRLLVSGGHISNDHGIPDNTLFTPGTQSWSKSGPMLRGRWYPTNTTLGNGDVVITAGRDQNGVEVEEPEVWSAASGTVRVLTTAKRVLPYYPRNFLAPDGRIFYAGEQVATRYLNPSGSGSWTNAGSHLYALPRDFGSAVMYDVGKILYTGGGRVTETAETIDLNSATPAWQWTGSMAFKRRHQVATVLPTGEVLVTSGSSGTAFNDFNAGVHAAEVWDPATGVWSTLASSTVTRTYHSTSVLLPDGRILVSGSGDAAGAPNEKSAEIFSPPYLFKGARPTITDAPSSIAYGSSFDIETPEAAGIEKMSLIRLGSMTHAFDMNQRFQWLSFSAGSGKLTVTAPSNRNHTPPGHYMLFILNGEGVPSVAKIVRVGGSGNPPPPPPRTISLTTSGREDATKQYMTLNWNGANGANVDVYRNGSRITSTANDGHYTNTRAFTGPASYVYKVCETGTTTCSNESTVVFGGNSPPSASFSASCDGLTCTMDDGSTDSDGSVTGWAWNFGDGTSASTQNPSHTYTSAGTYTITLTATDNGGAQGSTSRQVTVTSGSPSGIALTVSGRQDATKQYMTLAWTGATGANVDVYRNGSLITVTPNDGHYTNTRSFTGSATYVYKVCQAGSSVCSNEATVTFGGGPPGNPPPTANFTSSCTGLSCGFTDQSSDANGTVTGWSWTFGDGATSNVQNPTHGYGSGGSYTVTLTATDNGGVTGTISKTVTVGAPSGITLSVTGRSDATTHYMSLVWSGASGTMVDVYRNGALIKVTENDGRYTNTRNFTGTATYRYKVCQTGTTTCSNEATVTVS